jgi:coenzyme F420-0:L-glutamate ligase/coenzyme F420-1:gamma-L-glutamate ligase
MNSLELIALKDFPDVEPGNNIVELIINNINTNNVPIDDFDVIVIAQKVISKAENRYIDLNNINISDQAKKLALKLKKNKGLVQAIINESNKIISTEKNVIIVEHKLGFININAGIDQSNIPQADNIALLLPENPSKSAEVIQTNLSNQLNKNISIIISDSMTRPYRSGVINFALASSNIQSLIDLKGENDMYGNKLKGTEIAVADELASAAGLLMGQSDEKKPIVLIKGFNKSTYEVNNAFDLIMNENEDLYR